MEDPRYPLGPFVMPAQVTPETRAAWILTLETLPARMREAVAGLSDSQLDTPYREGGWTLRRVVHHVPDSHMHSYIRFKLALTEDLPTIKPYDEAATALLADYALPVEVSLNLLEHVHARWVVLLKAMRPEDFARVYIHPDNGRMTLEQALGLYDWHARHHLAHITRLRQRMGW
jgi:hypothetical protein